MTNFASPRFSRLAATLPLVGLMIAGFTSPVAAAPAAIRCGTVITSSTILTASVGPCTRGGLVIGADNVTLDLGGFAVTGRTNRAGDGVGILLSGRTGVTVKNGSVSDFDAGVAIAAGSANTIRDLLIKDNIGTTKRGDFGDGISIASSNANTIVANDVIHNGPFNGIGLVGTASTNLIENNVVSESNVPQTADSGIRIAGPGATNNIVRGNTVSGSTLDGIAVLSSQVTGPRSDGNIIEMNTVTANGFGILSTRPGDGIRVLPGANSTVVRNNVVTENAGSGILIASGSSSNEILTNTSTGNARQAAGSAFDLHDLNVLCDANTWFGNVYDTAFPVCAGS